MSIIDTPGNTTSSLACLSSKGVRTVIRYYNFSNSLSFPEKAIQLAEAQAIAAQGMQIAVVFQQRQNQALDFSELKGVAAGRRAYRYAHDNIAPYFQGIKRAFAEESGGTPDYRVGAYGSGFVCASLTEKGLIEFIWLAMSRGFRGTKEALSAGQFHLSQRAPAQTLCGLDVDFDDSNPDKPDFGAFMIEDDTAPQGQGAITGGVRDIFVKGLKQSVGIPSSLQICG